MNWRAEKHSGLTQNQVLEIIWIVQIWHTVSTCGQKFQISNVRQLLKCILRVRGRNKTTLVLSPSLIYLLCSSIKQKLWSNLKTMTFTANVTHSCCKYNLLYHSCWTPRERGRATVLLGGSTTVPCHGMSIPFWDTQSSVHGPRSRGMKQLPETSLQSEHTCRERVQPHL